MIRGRSALDSIIERGIANDGPLNVKPSLVVSNPVSTAAANKPPSVSKSPANTSANKPGIANKPANKVESVSRAVSKDDARKTYMRGLMAKKREAARLAKVQSS